MSMEREERFSWVFKRAADLGNSPVCSSFLDSRARKHRTVGILWCARRAHVLMGESP